MEKNIISKLENEFFKKNKIIHFVNVETYSRLW